MSEELTTYAKCKAIRDGIVRRAAEVMSYASWSDEFSVKEIREFPLAVKSMKNGEQYFGIQPRELTPEQAKELGFCKWSDENPIYLIPLYLLPFLAEEIEIGTISGEHKTIKRSDMDNDNRFGCLAYGVELQEAN